MKVYQIHEYGGDWDDKYDYISSTYLNENKAIVEKEKLEAQEGIAAKCDACPLNTCPEDCNLDCSKCTQEDGIARAKASCGRCDIETIEDENSSDGYYVYCKNKLIHFDDGYFRIEEVDVIE